jgi:ribosomal protein S18 acetylase RimI-like enzyme
MTFQVREAGPGDEANIVALIRELAAAGGDSSPVTEETVTAYLASPGSKVLLAEEEGRVVGLLSFSVRLDLYHGAPSGMIDELVVHGADRDRGVGSALVSEVLRRLEAMGCAEASVTTMPDNEGALRFYRSHGLVDEAVFLEKHF